MPSRVLREGILTSDRVDMLSAPAEVFYRRLMSVVDDFGRFDARLNMLKSACFPLRADEKVSEADVSRWLAECVRADVVAVYVVDRTGRAEWVTLQESAAFTVSASAKPYLELLDFKQQVRAKHSKYSAPPIAPHPPCRCDADDTHLLGRREASAPVVEVEVGDGDGARKRTVEPRTVRLPAGFGISDRVRSWAVEKGHGRLEQRLEQFIGYAKRSGKKYVDWDEAFMSAIREDWAGLGEQGETQTVGSKHVAL